MKHGAVGKVRDVGLLVVRLGFGLGFLHYHGWRKLLGGPEVWADRGEVMGLFGIHFGHTFWGFVHSLSESIGGLLFAVGLFFRPVCVLLLLNMVVASAMHYITGRGSPAHATKNAFLFAGMALVGPGRYSVDAWLARRRAAGSVEGRAEEEAVPAS